MTVMNKFLYYINHVQGIYPTLIHVKGGSILSAPNAPAQFEGHNERLHSDYTANVLEQSPNERPVSIIVAVDPFQFMYLPTQDMMRKEIQTICVHPGETVIFTNRCLHSGDINNSEEFSLRLFAYLVSNLHDFPANKVMLSEWTDTTENA
jgi:hypothetical protein